MQWLIATYGIEVFNAFLPPQNEDIIYSIHSEWWGPKEIVQSRTLVNRDESHKLQYFSHIVYHPWKNIMFRHVSDMQRVNKVR